VSENLYARACKFMVTEIGDELVALGPDGERSFGLDPIAGTVWRSLEQPKSFDQLHSALLDEYEVDAEKCSNDLRQLLGEFVVEGLVEECGGRSPSEPAEARKPSRWKGPEAAVSPEFSLLVRCCRWAFADCDPGAIHELCPTVDWKRFVRVARYHRVQGLAWNSLWCAGANVPQEIERELSSDSEAIVAGNLKLIREARELRAAFDSAGLRILFVKGLTVGALAYSRPMLKMGWDIDVLVDRSEVARAAAELAARGYRRTIPGPSVDLASWHSKSKESVWSRPEELLHVELHTRLADNRQLIPSIGIDSPRREVEVAPGVSLPTLTDDYLFAYLCVHGASSLWFRLKWITDVAAILHRAEPREIVDLYNRSQELGASRAADQALLLADSLYGSLRGTSLRPRLEKDRGSRWLAAVAMRQIAGRQEPREPTAVLLGTAWIHLTQLGLRRGLGFKVGEVVRQVGQALRNRLALRGQPN